MKNVEIIDHVKQSFENYIEAENLSEYRKSLGFIVRETEDNVHGCRVEVCFESSLYDLINDTSRTGIFDDELADPSRKRFSL